MIENSQDFTELLEGRISYSDLSVWFVCPHKFKLYKIFRLKNSPELMDYSINLDFGTAIHELLSKVNVYGDIAVSKRNLRGIFYKIVDDHRNFYKTKPTPKIVESTLQEGFYILDDVFKFFQHYRSDWQIFQREFELLEPMQNCIDNGLLNVEIAGLLFKGFIDLVMRNKTDNNKFWIVDYKTTASSWDNYARNDEIKQMQLLLYKYFWCHKNNVPLDNVKVSFLLLKKSVSGDNETRVEIVDVDSSTEKIQNCFQKINEALSKILMADGLKIKPSNKCKWCSYNKTKWCP